MVRFTALAALVASAGATGLTSNRRLEDGDYSWMNGYTLKYENCFVQESLVAFRLCPSENKCEAGCSGGGEYLVDLAFFIDAFSEAQMGAREYRCEMARENCDYDDEDQCYAAAGYEDCGDMNEDEDGFNVQEYLECREIENEYGDEDEYGAQYFVGPYCSEDNYNIYLGVFSDEYCSQPVDVEKFEELAGYELPYSAESLVEDECANCREHAAEQDQNGGDDAEDEDDVLEQCEELYEESNKCDSDLDIDYADFSACDYIEQLRDEENVKVGEPSNGSSSSNRASKIFWSLLVIAILACCGVGAWWWYMRNKKKADPLLETRSNQAMA